MLVFAVITQWVGYEYELLLLLLLLGYHTISDPEKVHLETKYRLKGLCFLVGDRDIVYGQS